ncbi:MAG: hypothetical protein ACKPBV_15580 [Sphaerospermopsis kisseleviana]
MDRIRLDRFSFNRTAVHITALLLAATVAPTALAQFKKQPPRPLPPKKAAAAAPVEAPFKVTEPKPPVTTNSVNLSQPEPLNRAGTRYTVVGQLNGTVTFSASDVELVVPRGAFVRQVAVTGAVSRIKLSGPGTIGQLSIQAGELTDATFEDVSVISDPALCQPAATGYNPYPNECFGIFLRKVRRVAIRNVTVASLVYAIWSDGGSEDILVENSRFHSTLGAQATLRLHDVTRLIVRGNRLENGAPSGDSFRHNFRIHGRSRDVFAANNLFVNSGVMIGEGGGGEEIVQRFWFMNNRMHQVADSLFQMGTAGVTEATISDNQAFSRIAWHRSNGFYTPANPPASWTIRRNTVSEYSPAPANAEPDKKK